MKNIVITSAVALIATATTAFAGGIAAPVMEAAPVAPVAVATPVIVTNDWSGFYLGGQIGTGDVELDNGVAAVEQDLSSYGVQAGYLYDLGSFVLGGEASYNVLDIDTLGDDNSVTRVGVIAGYDAGRFLPYLTGGYASLDVGLLDESDDGYYYGVGAMYAVTDSLNVGIEYLDHQFDDFASSGTDINAQTTSLKVNYAF
ncbi:Opacity protein [Loktanella fryxellensis]|uniref:Opacity protein n=1 Tax=Loktanella fryxellensis TaxID=245187 RepID=A0A1H7YIY5_9RHOB|nr:outer membrane beta-barrel protein [Loktanella fryxellensis]SEM45109.1 Opacity protein [Loktanella fryxellensis]